MNNQNLIAHTVVTAHLLLSNHTLIAHTGVCTSHLHKTQSSPVFKLTSQLTGTKPPWNYVCVCPELRYVREQGKDSMTHTMAVSSMKCKQMYMSSSWCYSNKVISKIDSRRKNSKASALGSWLLGILFNLFKITKFCRIIRTTSSHIHKQFSIISLIILNSLTTAASLQLSLLKVHNEKGVSKAPTAM